MTNHVHLAIQVGEVSLSRIQENPSFRYTRWVNWHYNRSGHLFRGRYKAVLVDAGASCRRNSADLELRIYRANDKKITL